jgi:hypothetical protein
LLLLTSVFSILLSSLPMTRHLNHIQPVSYEWSPIQKHRKHQNLRHKTITHPHKFQSEELIFQGRAKTYQIDTSEERSDSNCKSNTSVRSSQEVVLSVKIFWYKYFGCFSMKRKSKSRAGERQRKGLSQVVASLNEDAYSDENL